MHELRKAAEELLLDILCIQEPYTKNGSIPGMPVTARQIMADQHPMTAIVVFTRDVTTTVVQQYLDAHCVCVEVIARGCRLVLLNQYYQFADPIQVHLNKTIRILRESEDRAVLFVADVNAKSALWHSDITDDRGREVELMVAEADLDIVNCPGNVPTYQGRAGASSNIDVTMVSAALTNRIRKWKVEDGLTSSDHNLIHMEVGETTNAAVETTVVGRNFNLRRANWEMLRDKYAEQQPLAEGRVDDIAKELVKKVKNAMNAAIPRIKKTKKVSAGPWTEHLDGLRTEARRLRRIYQRSVSEDERAVRLQRYREAKATYTAELFDTKMRSWEAFVGECLQTDVWGIPYKIASEKIHPPALLSTLRAEDGTMTADWKETTEVLLGSLLPEDIRADENPEQEQMRLEMAELYNGGGEVPPFQREEIHSAINRLKKRKAPGLDLIQSEVVKALKDVMTEDLYFLFNKCLKRKRFPTIWKRADLVILRKGDRDPGMAGSYRPICLLSVLGKLLERLLCERLSEHRVARGLHPNQFGFRPGKSTEDAVNQLVTEVQNSDAKYVMAIFIDIAGAFDNLWWPALFRELRAMECPAALYGMLKSYCEDRYVLLRCPEETVQKHITKGCPQGSICGPIFWDIMMDTLLNELDNVRQVRSAVAYADDLAVIIEGNSRKELEEKAAEVMVSLMDWCRRNKMRVAAEKTQCALMKGALSRDPTIKMDGNTIRRKRVNKYLGVYLDEALNFHDHIERACTRASALMQKIMSMARRKYAIPLPAIRIYMSAVMGSITGYAASVWGHRLLLVKPKAAVRRTQRGVLVRVSGAFSTVSFEALAIVLCMMPLDLEIRGRAACYWLRKERHDRVLEVLGVQAGTRREVWEVVGRIWQEEWSNGQKGQRVREFFPSIAERENANYINPTRGLVHFLTGHGPYPQNLHRFGQRETPNCECGEMGSPEHVLYACALAGPEIRGLREQLGSVDTAATLRNPTEVEKLNRLADAVSRAELEKYRRR